MGRIEAVIKEARDRSGMTQRQIADAVGVSRAARQSGQRKRDCNGTKAGTMSPDCLKKSRTKKDRARTMSPAASLPMSAKVRGQIWGHMGGQTQGHGKGQVRLLCPRRV